MMRLLAARPLSFLAPFADHSSEHSRRALDVIHRYEFFGCMRKTDVARPKANRRNARLIEQGGICPCGEPFNADGNSFALDRGDDPFHHLRVDRDIARKLCSTQCNASVEFRAARLDSRARVRDLAGRLFYRLPGNRPSLYCHSAVLGIGRHPHSALDLRGMERATAE